MWTYYWYLIKKADLPEKFHKEYGEWILLCPDFPGLFLIDPVLLSKHSAMDNWSTKFMRERAQIATEKFVFNMMLRGETLPSPQKEMPGYFSFTVKISPQVIDEETF